MLAEDLREGEAALLVRALIDRALAGDAVALRFCVGRIVAPAPRGRAIRLDLPQGVGPGDVVAAFNAVLAAMATGEITPEEALTATRVLDGRRQALQAWDLERDLTRWGKVIPGDQAMRPQPERGEAATDAEDEDEDEDEEEDGYEDEEDDEGEEDEDEGDEVEGGEDEAVTASAPPAGGGADAYLAGLDALCETLEAAAEERRAARLLGRAFAHGAERAFAQGAGRAARAK